jgi:hypothetical protein
MYHPRIEYPQLEKSATSPADTVPVPKAQGVSSTEPELASPADSAAPNLEQS